MLHHGCHTLKFYYIVLYEIGKMLSGELSYPWIALVFIMSHVLCKPSHKVLQV